MKVELLQYCVEGDDSGGCLVIATYTSVQDLTRKVAGCLARHTDSSYPLVISGNWPTDEFAREFEAYHQYVTCDHIQDLSVIPIRNWHAYVIIMSQQTQSTLQELERIELDIDAGYDQLIILAVHRDVDVNGFAAITPVFELKLQFDPTCALFYFSTECDDHIKSKLCSTTQPRVDDR